MTVDKTSPTLLADVSKRSLPAEQRLRRRRLFIEGMFFTGISVLITTIWNVQQAGVFSIFFAAAALAGRFNDLLVENRDNIWVFRMNSVEANKRTAVGILAIFAGVTLAYVAIASMWGEARTTASFRFALDAAGLGKETIATRRFGSLGSLLSHNAAVLASFVILALVYRGFGALLALTWNACVWGVVLTVLLSRGVTLAEGSSLEYTAIAVAAIMPHLVLEATAYVLGALAGIFVSRGVVKYDVGTVELRGVMRAAGSLLIVACVLLVIAALVEHSFPEAMLSKLRAH